MQQASTNLSTIHRTVLLNHDLHLIIKWSFSNFCAAQQSKHGVICHAKSLATLVICFATSNLENSMLIPTILLQPGDEHSSNSLSNILRFGSLMHSMQSRSCNAAKPCCSLLMRAPSSFRYWRFVALSGAEVRCSLSSGYARLKICCQKLFDDGACQASICSTSSQLNAALLQVCLAAYLSGSYLLAACMRKLLVVCCIRHQSKADGHRAYATGRSWILCKCPCSGPWPKAIQTQMHPQMHPKIQAGMGLFSILFIEHWCAGSSGRITELNCTCNCLLRSHPDRFA